MDRKIPCLTGSAGVSRPAMSAKREDVVTPPERTSAFRAQLTSINKLALPEFKVEQLKDLKVVVFAVREVHAGLGSKAEAILERVHESINHAAVVAGRIQGRDPSEVRGHTS